MPIPTYDPPIEFGLTETDLFRALDFLVAIEPDPENCADYKAVMAPYRSQIDAAMKTLRTFAEQTEPLTLEQLQREYYNVTNSPRYLTSALVSSVVTASLNQAWDGVGSWRC